MIVIVLQTVLTFTRWGLYTVAVGSNKLGAAEAGVRVRLVTIRNFILCALDRRARRASSRRCARAPSSRTRPGRTKSCSTAIAAAVIGGTLLAGGSGTVVGALIGALFLGILHDGLMLQGVNANYLLFYLGLAIIVAMTRQRVRAARAQGARGQWLTASDDHRGGGRRVPSAATLRPTTCCASSTSPSASVR